MSYSKEWSLWSSHGIVLVFIALHPGSTVADIADGLSLTQRTIWGIVGDLRRAGVLVVSREGRRHRYSVNQAATFRHPAIPEIPLRLILGDLIAIANGRRSPVPASS